MNFSIGCGGNFGGLKGGTRERFAALCSVLFLLLCSVAGASAQTVNSSSYITPFPQGDRYQIRVIGDWYGAGLTAGLQDALKSEASLEVHDVTRSSYGLLRAEQSGLSAEADKLVSGGPVHVAVLMMGMNDRISIRTAAGNVQPGSAEWKELYGKEAEKLIKKLRAAGIAVYWVGLPPMSNPSLNEFVAGLNDTIRQAVYLNGAKFVETSAGFADQGGGYSAWGPDISGQTKRLRDGDGSGLTQAGYRKIASFVEVSIRRDLARARAQRNIPLAGDDEEQARVRAGHRAWLAGKKRGYRACCRLETRDHCGQAGGQSGQSGWRRVQDRGSGRGSSRSRRLAARSGRFRGSRQPAGRIHPGRAWRRLNLDRRDRTRGRFVDA